MGGQEIFCREHNLPLSTDYFKPNRKCSVPKNNNAIEICTRKSAWRFPGKIALRRCKTHFREFADSTDRVLVDNTH